MFGFWGCDPFVRRWLFLVFRICIFWGDEAAGVVLKEIEGGGGWSW